MSELAESEERIWGKERTSVVVERESEVKG